MRTLRRRGPASVALVLAASWGPALTAQEWSRFRGPNGSGISTDAVIPADFSAEDAVLWSTEVPFGRSSPVVIDDRIFLTGIEAGRLVTLAVSRDSGEILWWRSIERERVSELHQATDSATPSPATDGDNVYVFFQEGGLLSYDREGQERWRVSLGPFRNYYGMAASPIVVGDLVVLLCDQAEGSFLIAVDRNSGREVWRQSRAGRRESYTTPLVHPDPASPRWILVSGSKYLDAYDPGTGELAWTVSGLGAGPVASPVIADDRVYVVAPDQGEVGWEPFASVLAAHDGDGDGRLLPGELEGDWKIEHFGWLDADGDGWIGGEDWSVIGQELATDGWGLYAITLPTGDGVPEVAWNYRQNAAYIPTPLVYDGVLYMVKDSILTGLDAASGQLLKRGRLGAAKVYASPVAAGGRLLVSSLEGRLDVLRAGADWEIVASHDLGEEIFAAPALAGGELYLRTRGRLLAFAAGREPIAATLSP